MYPLIPFHFLLKPTSCIDNDFTRPGQATRHLVSPNGYRATPNWWTVIPGLIDKGNPHVCSLRIRTCQEDIEGLLVSLYQLITKLKLAKNAFPLFQVTVNHLGVFFLFLMEESD